MPLINIATLGPERYSKEQESIPVPGNTQVPVINSHTVDFSPGFQGIGPDIADVGWNAVGAVSDEAP